MLFLTADAFGVLPPISALSPEQAAYYFLSGYTAKLAGTEADMEIDVEATFSACFGAPFLPLPATTYATMLSERLREHGARCYLINTGWSGGPYGVGERIDIAATREMVRAVIAGRLDGAETRVDPFFGLNVPVEVPGRADGDPRPEGAPGATRTPTTSRRRSSPASSARTSPSSSRSVSEEVKSCRASRLGLPGTLGRAADGGGSWMFEPRRFS